MRQIIGWTRTSIMLAGLAALPLAAQTADPADPGRRQTPATQSDPRTGEPGTGMSSPGAIGTSPDTSRPGYGAMDRTRPNDGAAAMSDMNRTSPVDYDRDREGFNWGWLGLLGLAGLAGMRHRHAHRHNDVRNESVHLDDDRRV